MASRYTEEPTDSRGRAGLWCDDGPELTAAVFGPLTGRTGRSVRCGLVGSPVGRGADPGAGARAEVRVVLLDTGTRAQQEAAAGGLTAVPGVLLARVLAGPTGSRDR